MKFEKQVEAAASKHGVERKQVSDARIQQLRVKGMPLCSAIDKAASEVDRDSRAAHRQHGTKASRHESSF